MCEPTTSNAVLQSLEWRSTSPVYEMRVRLRQLEAAIEGRHIHLQHLLHKRLCELLDRGTDKGGE